MQSADLTGADLTGADMQGVQLEGARLSGASMAGVDLTGAILQSASLSIANLAGAALSGRKMEGADLSLAALTGADLSDVNIQSADFRRADISGAVVLESERGDSISLKDFSGAYTDFSSLGRDGDEYFIQARRAAACENRFTAMGLLRQATVNRPEFRALKEGAASMVDLDRDLEDHIRKNCDGKIVRFLPEKRLLD